MEKQKWYKNIWLCLKYPFLFPRNRFTGKHYNNWKIQDKVKKLYSNAYETILLDYTEEEITDLPILINKKGFQVSRYYGDYSETLDIHYKSKLIQRVKIYNEIRNVTWVEDEKGNHLLISIKGEPQKQNRHLLFPVVDKKRYYKAKLLEFWHDYILQIFHCIPTYTELDCMDPGWRKSFGEEFCKDLKRAIIKTCGWKALWKPWIMDIKEKWGELCVYLVGYNDGINTVIRKYTDKSRHTCIYCGKEATWITHGYILPVCDEHKGKSEATKIEKKEKDQ